ncbi:MAG: TIGR00730 family Rossman fold protein [Acidobacteria bacterium]|nr:TIGR00730 family Rossman fold protein [Acidobacteriota bacterium]
MKRICVFCGSSVGANPRYVKAAQELGYLMAKKNIGLVYGGASVGIMGEVASAVLKEGGNVIGVIPSFMVEKELAHPGLSELKIVNSMHERKALMAELSDGFIALPGGFGTFEEFFEVLTWGQLSIHTKPCGLLNICNYYDKLIEFIDHSVKEKFVKPECRVLVLTDSEPEKLLEQFENYQAPELKLLDLSKT